VVNPWRREEREEVASGCTGGLLDWVIFYGCMWMMVEPRAVLQSALQKVGISTNDQTLNDMHDIRLGQ
jgi:hypothetical protein